MDMASRAVYQIPAVSTGDIVSCLAQFVVLLLCHVTFASLVEAFFILSIHTALFLPFEVARGLYRNTQFFSARQRMTLFQAVVFSYVRVAFGYFDHEIARTFFSTANAEPFVKRRLGKQLWKSVRSFYEPRQVVGGWWIAHPDELSDLCAGRGPPDDRLVVLYIHGGGFALGSPTFYLEFLARLRAQLAASHPSLANCAIFAPYYPLAPEQQYPDQSISVEKAWKYLASHDGVNPSRLTVAGDSAGAALLLGLMSEIAKGNLRLPMPQQSILISPWPRLDLDPRQQPSIIDNASYDYVDPLALGDFASLLLHGRHPRRSPAVIRFVFDSFARTIPPLKKLLRWKLVERRAIEGTASAFQLPAASSMPRNGTLIFHGEKEVLRDQAKMLASKIHNDHIVTHSGKENALHAWPVYQMLLGRDDLERAEGFRHIVSFICKACD